MARILFVAKDNGCSSVTEQVAVLAREAGHDVVTALEGLAMARYEALGFTGEAPNWRGMVNFNSPTEEDKKKKLPSFDAMKFLDETRPDIIVTGLGSPINIQRDIAEEATRRKIPLVVCEDFWAKSPGHLDAAKVNPTLILTVDDYSIALNRKAFPHVSMAVVDNPGAKKVEVPPEVEAQMKKIREEGFDTIYVFAGGGASATNELALLLKCLEKTPGNYCIIPRFHPKVMAWKIPGESRTYGELWTEYLAPFAKRVRYVEAKSADPVAVSDSADVLVSGFSTLMTTAAYCGKRVICLKTSETVASLKAHGEHYTEIPQVALGLAHAVTEPTDLSQFGKPSTEAIKKLIPYDGKAAWQHIQELL